MSTTSLQKAVFLELRTNKHSDAAWESFSREWDSFMMAIIRRRMFSRPDLQEDCLMESYAKLINGIGGFDTGYEPSPWLASVVVSACEDVRRRYVERPIVEENGNEKGGKARTVTLGEPDELDRLLSALRAGQESERELVDDLWCCVLGAMERQKTDKRQETAFLLFYRYGYRLREIARMLGERESTVNNWPGSVLRKIRPEVVRDMEDLGYKTVGSGDSDDRRGASR